MILQSSLVGEVPIVYGGARQVVCVSSVPIAHYNMN